MHRVIGFIAILLPASTALAQDVDADGRLIKYQAVTELKLDEIAVDGVVVRPDGVLLGERRRASFKPGIRIRMDFNEEMAASTDEIR